MALKFVPGKGIIDTDKEPSIIQKPTDFVKQILNPKKPTPKKKSTTPSTTFVPSKRSSKSTTKKGSLKIRTGTGEQTTTNKTVEPKTGEELTKPITRKVKTSPQAEFVRKGAVLQYTKTPTSSEYGGRPVLTDIKAPSDRFVTEIVGGKKVIKEKPQYYSGVVEPSPSKIEKYSESLTRPPKTPVEKARSLIYPSWFQAQKGFEALGLFSEGTSERAVRRSRTGTGGLKNIFLGTGETLGAFGGTLFSSAGEIVSAPEKYFTGLASLGVGVFEDVTKGRNPASGVSYLGTTIRGFASGPSGAGEFTLLASPAIVGGLKGTNAFKSTRIFETPNAETLGFPYPEGGLGGFNPLSRKYLEAGVPETLAGEGVISRGKTTIQTQLLPKNYDPISELTIPESYQPRAVTDPFYRAQVNPAQTKLSSGQLQKVTLESGKELYYIKEPRTSPLESLQSKKASGYQYQLQDFTKGIKNLPESEVFKGLKSEKSIFGPGRKYIFLDPTGGLILETARVFEKYGNSRVLNRFKVENVKGKLANKELPATIPLVSSKDVLGLKTSNTVKNLEKNDYSLSTTNLGVRESLQPTKELLKQPEPVTTSSSSRGSQTSVVKTASKLLPGQELSLPKNLFKYPEFEKTPKNKKNDLTRDIFRGLPGGFNLPSGKAKDFEFPKNREFSLPSFEPAPKFDLFSGFYSELQFGSATEPKETKKSAREFEKSLFSGFYPTKEQRKFEKLFGGLF